MAKQLLDEELVAFVKTIFASFDEIIAEANLYGNTPLYYELISIGYDGTIQSILYNEYFWNMLTFDFMKYHIIYIKMINSETNILSRTVDAMPFINRRDNIQNIIGCAHHYLVSKWYKKYKNEVQLWAENEFGICVK